MADFTPVALGVKPPQGMTLGEMVGIAQGAQQYQQAQQLNPLQLQKAQMEIDQARKMNPLAVQRATTEANQAQSNFDKSHLDVTGGAITGLESRAKVHAEKKDFAAATRELEATEKMLNAYGFPSRADGPFAQAKKALENKDMGGYLATLENMRNIQASASEKFSSNLPQLGTVGGAPATYIAATGTAKPLTIGGQGGATGLTPPNEQQQVMQPPAVVGPPVEKQQGVTQTQMGLSYPVRRAGDIRPLAPNEAQDAERGAKYRNDLTTRQTDLSKSRRNLDEVIEAAGNIAKEDFFSTGVLGAATRTIKGALGDEKYKQLSKDLANVQISNMAAMGGSMETDAGKQLIRMANGDETYPPEVLKKIARRTYADLTNLDMQATGAAKFAQKYGDSNLNTFKQQWSTNADSKVFEAMSLFENIKDPAKRKDEIDRLLGNNPEQRQQFFQKYNNIKKLTATGEL